ncbi:hypothetical protein WOC76_22295 [Methylocystis sp. IM3]|uniref:hypothetical protein n=1 Tax=unclassified Methylocystis TaxID=2625913 RepID=UPI0030F83EE7
MEQLIDCQTRRDQTSADIDSDDRLATKAADFRPETEEAKYGERIYDNLLLPLNARDRDIDKAANKNRYHDPHSNSRLQMKLSEPDDHHLAESKGKQNEQQEREREGQPDEYIHACFPSN